MSLPFAQIFSSGFLAPGLAAAGAAAISIPIVIHLLSRRPRRPEPWGAMRFLLAAYRKHRMRVRAEQWLLLAARCLLVALIGLALAGPVLAQFGDLAGLGGGGRTLVLIVDNGVTSGAIGPRGEPRLDRLKRTAQELIDALGPGDRAALITASRPVKTIIGPPTSDQASVRRQIRQLRPSPAASDIPAALRRAMRMLQQQSIAAGKRYIVVLSDFSAGVVRSRQPLPAELEQLGEMATLLRTAGMPSANNIQILAMRPRRRVILHAPDSLAAEGGGGKGGAAVHWEIVLRRFGDKPSATTTLRIKAPGAAPVQHTVQWTAGRKTAQVRLSTPIRTQGLAAVTASISTGSTHRDALKVDNQRVSVVQVRNELRVLLLGRGGAAGEGDRTWSAQRWVRVALAPVTNPRAWPIQVVRRDPAALTPEMLRGIDAVFAVRPDLIEPRGFTMLRKWLSEGGVLWMSVPPAMQPALWMEQVNKTLGMSWSGALEPVKADPPLRLSPDQPPSRELARLEAELPALLRPIEVYRYLPLDAQSIDERSQVLLYMEGGRPLLIAGATPGGEGRVLLLSTATDPRWTNLPTKPFFVPLIHEVLRVSLDRLQPAWSFASGARPVLGGVWLGVSRLVAPKGEAIRLAAVRTNDGEADSETGVRPVQPLITPGAYQGAGGGAVLAVNVEPNAANTLSSDPALLQNWLEPAGSWRVLQPDAPARSLGANAQLAVLSWPLLWAALALALAETLLARWASHARKGDEGT